MATYTTNYNLEKPAQTDIYNVDVFNDNADKVDAALTDKAEKTMLAPVESTNQASRAYAVGEYFVFNGYLCRATAAIASGGTIAIGTNCASTAAGTELTSLKDALPKYKLVNGGQSITVDFSNYTMVSVIGMLSNQNGFIASAYSGNVVMIATTGSAASNISCSCTNKVLTISNSAAYGYRCGFVFY